jgi:hypothetical protein
MRTFEAKPDLFTIDYSLLTTTAFILHPSEKATALQGEV